MQDARNYFLAYAAENKIRAALQWYLSLIVLKNRGLYSYESGTALLYLHARINDAEAGAKLGKCKLSLVSNVPF